MFFIVTALFLLLLCLCKRLSRTAFAVVEGRRLFHLGICAVLDLFSGSGLQRPPLMGPSLPSRHWRSPPGSAAARRGWAPAAWMPRKDKTRGRNGNPTVSPDTLFAADGAVDRPSRQCFKTERAFRSVFSQRLLTTGERLWYTSTRILNRRL